MKGIFLANTKSNIPYVYSAQSIEKIKRLVEIDENKVYHQDDIISHPNDFADVDFIFSTWSMPGGGDEFLPQYFPNLKCLFYAAGSVKYFAPEYFSKNVRVFSAFQANAIPVAEYATAQILLANKGFFGARVQKEADYEKNLDFSSHHAGNYHAKVGIVGVGMIGRTVINLLKPYCLDIYVYDTFLSEEKANALGVKKIDTLPALFETCDVISNHLANVPATVGIYGKECFEKMKPYATFINTGRGAQVNEEEMISVFSSRPDCTALLDVTIDEPVKEGSPLYRCQNVILTPHIAGSRANEVQRMSEYMADELERYLKNEPLLYEVTEKMLATMA